MHHVRSWTRSEAHTHQVSFSGKKPVAGGTKTLLIGLKTELPVSDRELYRHYIIITSIISNVTLFSSILWRNFMVTKSDEECPV